MLAALPERADSYSMSFNLASIINDALYMQFVRKIRWQVRGLRRRSLIATLYRAMQETDPNEKYSGVEVGVKFGTLSQQILESLPNVSMTLVDPWKEFPADHPDRGVYGYASRKQRGWDSMADDCRKRMHQFGSRAGILRTTSLDAAKQICGFQKHLGWYADYRRFFVYIDAGHSYEDVLADCRAWFPLIQEGGILCGDDYREPGHKDRTESVSSAVEAFAKEVGLPVIGLHRNFFIGPK